MKSFVKKVATALVASSLALVGFAGCTPGAAAPTNAKELLERYEALEDKTNCHMDFDITMGIELFGSSMDITMDGGYDIADKNAHGTMSMDLLGESMEIESYVESGDGSYVQYAGYTLGGETSWVKQTQQGEFLTTSVSSVDVLGDAEFAATDTGYTLTADGSSMVSSLSAVGGTDMFSGLDEATLKEMFKDSTMVYTFDKDFHITAVSMNLNYSGEEQSVSYALNMSMNATYSNYGKVDAASVVVPDDIKSSAFDEDALSESLTELTDELESLTETTSADATSADAASTAETTSVAAAA